MPYWRLFYHFVWATKNRQRLILDSFAEQLHSAIAAKAIELGAVVHATGGIEDHVHLAASVPPSLSLAQFIGQVKGSSSHAVNHVFNPEAKFQRQDEYGVISFGEKNLSYIVDYINTQREHHQRGTMVTQLENGA